MGTVLNFGNMHILCSSLSRKSATVTPIIADLCEWCEWCKMSMFISTFWRLSVHFMIYLHKITKFPLVSLIIMIIEISLSDQNYGFYGIPRKKNVSNLSMWDVLSNFWCLCVIFFENLHKIIKFPLVSLITWIIEISLYDQNYGFYGIPRQKNLSNYRFGINSCPTNPPPGWQESDGSWSEVSKGVFLWLKKSQRIS